MANHVIKENDVFLLTDPMGNITQSVDDQIIGLFSKDTRFLSQFEMDIEGLSLILVESDAGENFLNMIRMKVERESVFIERRRFISNGVLYERISFYNNHSTPVELSVSIKMAADFKDMFEVRGFMDGQKGEHHAPVYEQSGFRFGYTGRDHVYRSTVVAVDAEIVTFSHESSQTTAHIPVHISSNGNYYLHVMIRPEIYDQQGIEQSQFPFIDEDKALLLLKESYLKWDELTTHIETDNASFNRIVERAKKDIRVLLTDVGYGDFPVAGLPIFAVPFGRDSMITALQLMAVQPEIARGTLRTMAAYQGTENNAWKDEQPGKIMHEIRYGELANSGMVPFSPYYGSIDSTPLFLILAAEYFKWTGDFDLIAELEPAIEKAIEWIGTYGDRDGDGYVEYLQESSKGIPNQGWKDSDDSIVHRNGSLARGRIALAEVQGYVYAAKTGTADLYERLGRSDRALTLRCEAEELKDRFARDFWMEDEQFVAIALDGEKQQVRSITSNPGHCLWSGFLTKEQAKSVSDRLLSEDMFAGWGIRTMSTHSAGYNPNSYHNGSIWPHDNSLIVLGLRRYGYHEYTNRVIEGMIDAATYFEYDRLPELFCGQSSKEGPPIHYPVACSPQAWAAGTPLLFIWAILGIQPDVPNGVILINAQLPASIHVMEVQGLRVGKGYLDLLVQRLDEGPTTCAVLRNSTMLAVVNE